MLEAVQIVVGILGFASAAALAFLATSLLIERLRAGQGTCQTLGQWRLELWDVVSGI